MAVASLDIYLWRIAHARILTHHLKVLETTRLHVPEKVNVKMYTDYAGFACLPEEIGDDEYLDDGLGV